MYIQIHILKSEFNIHMKKEIHILISPTKKLYELQNVILPRFTVNKLKILKAYFVEEYFKNSPIPINIYQVHAVNHFKQFSNVFLHLIVSLMIRS